MERLTPVGFASEDNLIPKIQIGSRPSVLVVEDDDNSLFMLKSMLMAKGYRVLAAWDGKQAVEMAEACKPDLMLLDIQLPRLNGIGVVHRIRENVALESLPIVVMTGCSPEEYRGSAISSGCDDFLLKPIDFDRLDVLLDYYVPLRPETPPTQKSEPLERTH